MVGFKGTSMETNVHELHRVSMQSKSRLYQISMQKSMEVHSIEFPWSLSMDLHGPPWNSVEAPRRAPAPMDTFTDLPRKSVDPSMEVHELPRKCPWSSQKMSKPRTCERYRFLFG